MHAIVSYFCILPSVDLHAVRIVTRIKIIDWSTGSKLYGVYFSCLVGAYDENIYILTIVERRWIDTRSSFRRVNGVPGRSLNSIFKKSAYNLQCEWRLSLLGSVPALQEVLDCVFFFEKSTGGERTPHLI